MRPDRTVVESWLQTETARLLVTVDSLWDDDLSKDSALPGWSLGHLLSHLARNADALGNLLLWARTGVETPMYSSGEQRTTDINVGARRLAAEIISDVVDSADRLQANSDKLTAQDWESPVRTAQGRTIPASLVPWLRLREVLIHHIDLGASVDDVPPLVAAALLDDVAAWTSKQPEWPSLRLGTVDTAQFVTTGAEDVTNTVSGTAAQLVAWLIGRSAGEHLSSDQPLPILPPWL
ncbi:maleylpyruvate isomerase family mycothiol-dependent enzyme [Mycolicibacterium sp. lyk4-40-TYG-92]|uniref:maleylpyruvate isomerase family mycothiol-dependent enzyme n=1 Tax=Mycolicibacterium sp. lyk4-40-TYG-92 TaxID=3040295 RepID=UPI00254C062A|nr:maleylpyruvate isomerase family mycothiol-dependent enzyme [Mycolicibacterium sp. lyk4-40-TYG-92]